MTRPPPKRRLAVVLAVLAVLAAAGGIYAVVNRPGGHDDGNSPAQAPQATLFYSLEPPSAAPRAAPTSAAASPTRSPTPKLSFDDALIRLRTAVQAGADAGEIRGDVATVLLNLVRNLGRADTKNVSSQVGQLRRKISERNGEGSVTDARAAVLRARVSDLDRAAGM
jgi:serine/threonine-protein kinase